MISNYVPHQHAQANHLQTHDLSSHINFPWHGCLLRCHGVACSVLVPGGTGACLERVCLPQRKHVRVIVAASQQSPPNRRQTHSFFQLIVAPVGTGDCCDVTALRGQRSCVPRIIHISNAFWVPKVRVIVERLLFQKDHYLILVISPNNRPTITRTGGIQKVLEICMILGTHER